MAYEHIKYIIGMLSDKKAITIRIILFSKLFIVLMDKFFEDQRVNVVTEQHH